MDKSGNKALLLGCGNIGAGYDLDDTSGKVLSHAKALSVLQIPADIYDADVARAITVADKYGFRVLNEIPEMNGYSIICIATPTSTHFQLLEKAFNAEVPLIICEKPIGLNASELKKLRELRKLSGSVVLVNYMRRFQPQYHELRADIISGKYGEFIGGEITYCRGFINNGSHALDLVEFLFGQPVNLDSFQKISFSEDVFEGDPTISGQFLYKSAPMQLTGLSYAQYRVFEIRLFFTSGIIDMMAGGDIIQYYKASDTGNLTLEKSVEGILHQYMLPVYTHAQTLTGNTGITDNFENSMRLNLEMLTVINK